MWAMRAKVRRGAPPPRLDELLRSIDEGIELPLTVPPRWIVAGLTRARRLSGHRDTCLYRSIAGYAALRRLGHRPSFIIGVSDRDGLAAHAWLELDGLSTDPHASSFTPIFRHP